MRTEMLRDVARSSSVDAISLKRGVPAELPLPSMASRAAFAVHFWRLLPERIMFKEEVGCIYVDCNWALRL
jgi:hypothetical protein